MKESSWQRMNGPRDDIEEDEIQFMSFEETKEVYRDDEEQSNYWNQFLRQDRDALASASEDSFFVTTR